jgi:ligand-binding sensor domain-containing protein
MAWLVLAAVLAVGCVGLVGPAGSPSTPPQPTRATPTGPTAAATADGAVCGPDSAWIASWSYGVACLGADGWSLFDNLFHDANETINAGVVNDVAACADGTTWISGAHGLTSTDGRTWISYPATTDGSAFTAIACDADHGVWLTAHDGVSYFDGEQIVAHASSNLGSAEWREPSDVAVATDGTVWVATSSSVAMWDGQSWTRFEYGHGLSDSYSFQRITVDGAGRPWTIGKLRVTGDSPSWSDLLVYEDGNWQVVDSPMLSSASSLAVDGSDRLWVGGSDLSVFNGASWESHDRATSDLPSYWVGALATDADGRIWIGTEYGLAILDGDRWTVYHMADSGIPDNVISALAVAGHGPALPAPAVKPGGTLTGRIWDGGEAQPGLAVEVMMEGEPMSMAEGSCMDDPAPDGPWWPCRTTTSGPGGTFTFADLPVGRYTLRAEGIDGTWYYIITGPDLHIPGTASNQLARRFLVESNTTLDLGDLPLGS